MVHREFRFWDGVQYLWVNDGILKIPGESAVYFVGNMSVFEFRRIIKKAQNRLGESVADDHFRFARLLGWKRIA